MSLFQLETPTAGKPGMSSLLLELAPSEQERSYRWLREQRRAMRLEVPCGSGQGVRRRLRVAL